MRFNATLAVFALFVSAGPLASAQAVSAQSAQLQVSENTEAPGVSLAPGTYTVRIADHLSDRVIVQFQKAGSSNVVTLLAYPNSNLLANGGHGPITYQSGLKHEPTLRGYAFPGGTTLEFVYPKKDAVTLAKANNVRVMAVDPASENLPKLPQLTKTDMDEVTLWMLTPTPVGPTTGGKPGIQAERYQASANSYAQASTPAPAQNNTGAEAYSNASSQAAYNTPSQPSYRSSRHATAANAPVQVANNEPPRHLRPAVKQLPHTASNLPLIVLAGCLSLLFAIALRLRAWLSGTQHEQA